MWNQVYDPFNNATASTIAAALPVVTLLVLIASNKVKAHVAAIQPPRMVRTRSRAQSARHRVDHSTIYGRTCANSRHDNPLCACVDRIFVNPNSAHRRPEKFGARRLAVGHGRAVDVLQLVVAALFASPSRAIWRRSPGSGCNGRREIDYSLLARPPTIDYHPPCS
jgi:hypothetical protein